MLLLALTTLFSLASLTAASVQKPLSPSNHTSAFSFNLDLSYHPRWLTLLPNNASLTRLSFPGTHDSLTHLLTSPTYRCQNHPLTTQLQAGIRYLDIRARLISNNLLIYHESAYTTYTYASVLLTIFDFLRENPGEFVLMRLKEESVPINSTIGFEEAFNYYRLFDPETAGGCREHFYLPPPSLIPSLDDLRGKVLILQNFGDPTQLAKYGIKWESPLLEIEDLWEVDDLYEGLDGKWEAVRRGFENAEKEDGKLYLTHLSASVGVLPVEAAAGKEVEGVVGINERAGRWLRDGRNGSLGVVIVDFPGAKLVEEVLKGN